MSKVTPREPKVKNLTRAEKEGITELQNHTNIIIKPADKGSAVVVMNKSDYIAEGNRQVIWH